MTSSPSQIRYKAKKAEIMSLFFLQHRYELTRRASIHRLLDLHSLCLRYFAEGLCQQTTESVLGGCVWAACCVHNGVDRR